MRLENKFLRYLRNIGIIIFVFYIGTILGYVILGKGSLIDAISLKSIKHTRKNITLMSIPFFKGLTRCLLSFIQPQLYQEFL